MTSSSGRGVREAYGLVYLEAQATGLPVVAFDSGGVSATVRREEALLAPDGDAAALRDALARLLTDRALRARMSAAAQSFVARRAQPRARPRDHPRRPRHRPSPATPPGTRQSPMSAALWTRCWLSSITGPSRTPRPALAPR